MKEIRGRLGLSDIDREPGIVSRTEGERHHDGGLGLQDRLATMLSVQELAGRRDHDALAVEHPATSENVVLDGLAVGTKDISVPVIAFQQKHGKDRRWNPQASFAGMAVNVKPPIYHPEGESKLRIVETVLKRAPSVVSAQPQGLDGAIIDTSVVDVTNLHMTRANPFPPGSRAYIAHASSFDHCMRGTIAAAVAITSGFVDVSSTQRMADNLTNKLGCEVNLDGRNLL